MNQGTDPKETTDDESRVKPLAAERLAGWLEGSLTKRILVPFFVSLIAITGLGTATWTLYKEYAESIENPEITLRAFELGATMRWVTVGQTLGMQGSADERIFKMGSQVPTFSVSFDIRNPTPKRRTFTDCLLEVRLKGEKESKSSSASISTKSARDNSIEQPLIITVDPGTTTIVERVFTFNQINMEKLTDTERNGQREFKVTCFNEKKEPIKTEWSEASLL